MRYNITSKAIRLGLMTNTYKIKENHNVLFNEENESLSNSERDVWITFYSLLQIEYVLNDVDIKQLVGTTTTIVVVGHELQKVSPCMVIN